MITILGVLFICILMGTLIPFTDSTWKEKKVRLKVGIGWSTILATVWAVAIIIIIYSSYESYLGQRAFYDATVEQYTTAVTMYEDKAVIDIESAAWTDFKYKGYQDNISSLVLDLRRNIIKYNDLFIRKNKMHANLFFSWLIVGMDDDMKIITMRTANQRLKQEVDL